MKVDMLSWEFPPRIVGGIARHCFGLSRALARMGHEVRLITLEFPGALDFEEVDGVAVHRVRIELGHPDFLTWVLIFNHFMEKHAARVNARNRCDVIHAHDWLVSPASICLKHHLGKSLVLTMHSTEVGRSQVLRGPDSYTIDGFEWWSTFEASRVIVTSEAMRREVIEHFKLPEEKVFRIPNGVEVEKFEVDFDRRSFKLKYAASDERIILFVGRLTPQKGVEHLIRAFPLILQRHPESKLVIVGDGWLSDDLRRLANSTGRPSKIYFTGFLPEDELVRLLLCADVLVIPSVYEPFGIVALEGMAAGVPVVASNVNGLSEVIQHGRNGILTYPANPESIAWGVDQVLSNPGYAKYLVENAKSEVSKRYSWDS
ncbi:MAG: glycosyltransferase family 4 protein, partial [Candidatus Bathyarchaeia archaeon]